MPQSPSKRRKLDPQAVGRYPHWATLLLRPSDSKGWTETEYVPLADIQIVRPSHSGLLDIVYTSVRRLPSGITVHEIKSGETTIDQLLIALGWQAGMSHNEHLAKLTDFRFET